MCHRYGWHGIEHPLLKQTSVTIVTQEKDVFPNISLVVLYCKQGTQTNGIQKCAVIGQQSATF